MKKIEKKWESKVGVKSIFLTQKKIFFSRKTQRMFRSQKWESDVAGNIKQQRQAASPNIPDHKKWNLTKS